MHSERGGGVDAELLALASTAGTTVVTALTTDMWERARTSIGGLWQRAYPDRAGNLDAELVEMREQLLSSQEASRDGDDTSVGQQLEEDLTVEWRGRFRRLLIAHPDLASALRQVLDEDLSPALPSTAPHTTTVFHAAPTGHARVYQAGGNQHINER